MRTRTAQYSTVLQYRKLCGSVLGRRHGFCDIVACTDSYLGPQCKDADAVSTWWQLVKTGGSELCSSRECVVTECD